MAGSLTQFVYVDDSGNRYVVNADKSNSNATVGGTTLMDARVVTDNNPEPKGLKRRYVIAYSQSNPLIRRKFWVGNPAAITKVNAVGATILAEDYPGGSDAAGVQQIFVISAYRGEKRRLIPTAGSPDTGLTV